MTSYSAFRFSTLLALGPHVAGADSLIALRPKAAPGVPQFAERVFTLFIGVGCLR